MTDQPAQPEIHECSCGCIYEMANEGDSTRLVWLRRCGYAEIVWANGAHEVAIRHVVNNTARVTPA